MAVKNYRRVCADKGEQHYSATYDLAMERCPKCDAPVVAVDPEEAPKGTLFHILKNADGIDIDGTFCREFNLDETAEGEDWAISLDLSVDGGEMELRITMDELLGAWQNQNDTWIVACTMYEAEDTVVITPYKLQQII